MKSFPLFVTLKFDRQSSRNKSNDEVSLILAESN